MSAEAQRTSPIPRWKVGLCAHLVDLVGDDPDLFIGVRLSLDDLYRHDVRLIQVFPGAPFKVMREEPIDKKGTYGALLHLIGEGAFCSVGIHGGWELYRPLQLVASGALAEVTA